MINTDKTHNILYWYLRLLAVKVSKVKIKQILDIPVGNTLRGISDALDNMQVKNSVYQLPLNYLNELEVPFVAVTHSKEVPFCIVSKLDKENLTLVQQSGKKKQINRIAFLKMWTGTVLLGEKTEQTIDDNLYWIKNLFYYIQQYQYIIVGMLLLCLPLLLFATDTISSMLLIYLLVLFLGMLVSALIIYKESVNDTFMQRICKVGDVIDCNHVLQSKGGQLFGFHLGELSMIYFSTLYFFALGWCEHVILLIISALGCIFTFYSVFYQAAVLRKWCFLCMIDVWIIWISTFVLYQLNEAEYTLIRFVDLFYFLTIGGICFIAVNIIKQQISLKQYSLVLEQKQANLMNPELFPRLLSASQFIKVPTQITVLSNGVESNDYRIQVITNPNCSNCAKLHEQLMMISNLPIDLIFVTNNNDLIAKKIAKEIIDTYLLHGWIQAMEKLNEWFKEKNKFNIKNNCTERANQILFEQQKFCEQINLKHTPFIMVNGYALPNVYELKDLRYLI
ncbi:vitamin K epoxide reductase family protein [Bacteroides sp. 519]|uniref:vitamin K epoxide reductase family protein n=1 Tax=Bacteroides sp. 519 TaxID=2302937 RepID=UPI0013D34DE5|nr:vitamin K epoxide reductase family protein [Bacteroides sp. 519]NDV57506.1 hypothetical protein [Bacteroides sp. 519]